jgi:hypothetical protein
MKKNCFLESWKRMVMLRRRVRITIRPTINPFTFFSMLGCVSSGRVESVSIQIHHLTGDGSG